MPYTLQQAGTAAGISKSSMLRAVRRGTVSAVRDPITGNWAIDPAELHRVFPPKPNGPAEPAGTVSGAILDASRTSLEAALERQITELKAERERERDQLRETISDLRRRLDTTDEERRRLTAILADQRAAPAPIRRWWRFGR